MIAHTGAHDILEMGDGIRGPSVLSEAIVIQVQAARGQVDAYIFQDGAEPPGAFINFWLRGRTQPDHFGVTAPLKIKDAPHAPAVLVIADELAGRVRGQAGLAGSGKAEKQGRISVLALVSGTVHGQHFLLGQVVIKDGEHRFFDLPGIGGAADDDELSERN